MNFGVKRKKCKTFAKASYVGNINETNAKGDFLFNEDYSLNNFSGNGADNASKCIDRKLEREKNNIIESIKKLTINQDNPINHKDLL